MKDFSHLRDSFSGVGRCPQSLFRAPSAPEGRLVWKWCRSDLELSFRAASRLTARAHERMLEANIKRNRVVVVTSLPLVPNQDVPKLVGIARLASLGESLREGHNVE